MCEMNYSDLACFRNGLRFDGCVVDDLGNCPSYGSSDCPITMEEPIRECRCTTNEMYEWLGQVLESYS